MQQYRPEEKVFLFPSTSQVYFPFTPRMNVFVFPQIMEEKETDCSDEGDQETGTAEHNSVKSTAVVKYSAVDTPASFALLQCNTDLNLPPANWLSSSAESYGLQYVLSNTTGFSRYCPIFDFGLPFSVFPLSFSLFTL